MSRILVLDDEEVIRMSMRRLLERNGYTVAEAGSVEEALERHDLTAFDLIVTDLRLPGAEGTEIIDHADGVPVLIMTSYASVRSAVESMKRGAVDYIAKPFDHDELLMLVRRILDQVRLERQNRALKSQLAEAYPVSGMVGSSPAMRLVTERIHKVAPTNTTVLILGESGTGKELVARAVHEHSLRSNAPLITVNCAAIPETLIESELFGHEKGAFTGAVGRHAGLVEAADGGTLFLDEIGELPLAAQSRLLRVLQEGEIRRVGSAHSRNVDVRLVAATHRDLRQLVEMGAFRDDLFFRLHVVEVRLPPLRERGDDITELARFLLEKGCRRLNRPPIPFTDEALAAIKAHPWPGNVRELENAIERAVILSDGPITTDALALSPVEVKWVEPPSPPPEGASLDDYFIRFVREHEGQLTETELAKRLGISRKTLWERRSRLGIPRSKGK